MDVDDALLAEVLDAEAEAEPADAAPADPDEADVVDTEDELTAAHSEPESAEPPPPEEEGITSRLDLVRLDDLAGVPLYYARGRPQPERHRPWAARSFVPVLEATVRQVQARAPAAFGKLERIVDAGLYTPESDKLHTVGRACDWDRWTFAGVDISPYDHDHESPSRPRRCRYWALAAICRANSCYVLHGLWNAAHENHIHQDNGYPQPFNTMKSTVQLCQAVLNDIFGQSPKLSTDGRYGDRTAAALEVAFRRLAIDGTVTDRDAWTKFLRRSARLGFEISTRL